MINLSLDQGFSFWVSKNKNLVLMKRILLVLSMKSHFRTPLGHWNESKRGWNQEIQWLNYLNSSIARTMQKYIFVEERVYIEFKLGMAIWWFLYFDLRLWLILRRWIVIVKSWSLDPQWSIQIMPHHCVKISRRVTVIVWSSSNAWNDATGPWKSIGSI